MKYRKYRCTTCERKGEPTSFPVNHRTQQVAERGGKIFCPVCGSTDTYDTGYKW